MRFNYQGRSSDGQIQSGSVEASSQDEAVEILQRNNIYVTFLEEEKTSIYGREIAIFERVTSKDIVLFSRQLAIMFKAGVPIVESLRSIAKQTKKNRFREQINKIGDKVESGNTLSQSLEGYPKLFTPFYIGMVKSGEVSGRLSESLEYLADHLEQEYNFNSKIVASLVYPGFILFVFVAILVLLVVFVVPKLSDIFEGMDLPLMTRVVLGTGELLVKWWWVPILGISAGVFFFIRFARTEAGKKTIDAVSLRIPIVGEFIKKINLVRIAENISTLIAGGLPIVQALEVTAGVLGSNTYRKIIHETRDGVRRGELMSVTLTKYPDFFPALFLQMVIVGEKTGNVDSSLSNVVNFYQGDIDRSLEGMVKLLEPLMIILIGGMIGLMVISILTPIYQITI
ncbi:MAG: type II secretion system F family protein [Minisyncoccales bacterium]|jgi:type IV pilus assembly protein PilC